MRANYVRLATEWVRYTIYMLSQVGANEQEIAEGVSRALNDYLTPPPSLEEGDGQEEH